MNNSNIIWLASYPRSGNTFLRTILWHCFGLKSASVYANDLGGNAKLEKYVGHIEYSADRQLKFPKNGLPLIKTHQLAQDDNPAIYVIRDGRAACVSLWMFDKKFNPDASLEPIINGQHRFGSWGDHVQAWNPWERPNTLLLEYENMKNDMPVVLDSISHFLHRNIISDTIPERETIAGVDGRWVKNASNWQSNLNGEFLQKFNKLNNQILKQAGYLT